MSDLAALRAQSNAAVQATLDLIPPYRQAYADVGQASFGDSVEASLQNHAARLSADTTAWLQNLEDLSGGTSMPDEARSIPSFHMPQNREESSQSNPYSKGQPCRWFTTVNGVFGDGVPLGVGPGDMFTVDFQLPGTPEAHNRKSVMQLGCVGVGGEEGNAQQERVYTVYDEDGNTVTEVTTTQLALKMGYDNNPSLPPKTNHMRPGGKYRLVIVNNRTSPRKQNFYLSAAYTD